MIDPASEEYQHYYPIVKYSAFTTSLLSILSVILVVYVYVSRPSLRNFSFRLLLYLQIADLIMAVCMFLQIADPVDHYGLCQIQAFVGNLGCLSSFAWTCCISSAIYFSCTGKWHDVEAKEKPFLLICTLFPLVVSLIPLAIGEYGVSGYWCWVKFTKSDNQVTRSFLVIFILFLYLWFAVLYNTVLIVLTFKFFYNEENRMLLSMYNQQLRKTLLFPLIMVVLWACPSLYRILQIFNLEVSWLSVVHAICEGSNGFVNTLVYVMNRKFRDEMKKSLRRTHEEMLIAKL